MATRHFRHGIWRWFTGAAMDGIYRTDAGWFTRGKRAYHKLGRVYTWHYLPRVIRAGVRWALTTYVAGTLLGLALNFWLTVALSGAVLAGTATVGTLYGIQKVRGYWRNVRTVTPLSQALGIRLDVAAQEMEKYLHLPKNYHLIKQGKVGRLDLPTHFGGTPGEKSQVEQVISAKIKGALEFVWDTSAGKGGYVQFNALEPLPTKVDFRDYIEEFKNNKPGEYIAGVESGKRIHRESFDGDEVHHAFSFNTGRGKSMFLTMMLIQILMQNPGNRATIIDTKMESLIHLLGLPGVTIHADPEHIEDMVRGAEEVYKVMKYRLKAQTENPTLRGTWPMEMLVLEEGNDFAMQLMGWWLGVKGKGDPATCPFWRTTIAPILWQGRSVNVHMVGVFQNFMEKFFGNMSLRMSFGLLGLSGFRPNGWKAMVGTMPAPKAQPGKGRIILTNGDEETWIQSLYDPLGYKESPDYYGHTQRFIEQYRPREITEGQHSVL
jgi:hypothetical protein